MVTKNSSWRMRAGFSNLHLSRGGNRTTGKDPAAIVARTQYPRVNMLKTRSQVKLDNGFVQLIFSRPSGDVVGIKYKGIDNLLENKNLRNNRGYWDVVWNNPGENKIFVDKLQATRFRVITARADQVEISFVKTYNVSQRGAPVVPLNVDKRYIMQRAHSGFYAYAIFEYLEGWPEVKMDRSLIRLIFLRSGLQRIIYNMNS